MSPKLVLLSLATGLASLAACAHSTTSSPGSTSPAAGASTTAPSPDPRVGLRGGTNDAGQAIWNLRRVSSTPPSQQFVDGINSDLAFKGNDVIQGSFNGYQVWDISNPGQPSLKTAFVCPGSQSDVSVYHNLLFVSGENLAARLDCGAEGVEDTVSAARLRGIRIYDISDIGHPKNVGNVQTCRGSHTHTLLVDPKDKDNVYLYISGQAPVRSPSELAGCVERAQGSQLGPVPDRGHQGPAGPSGAGGHRELTPDLQQSGSAAEAWRHAGGQRRERQGGGRCEGAPADSPR